MSLYILCQVRCVPSNTESLKKEASRFFEGLGIGINFDGFEEDEKSMLVANGYEWRSGVEFRLSDSSEKIDATNLWNEAMVECRRILLDARGTDATSLRTDVVASMALPDDYFFLAARTRLGRAIDMILDRLGSTGGVIALVEGGIEKMEFCSRGQCLKSILRFLLVPWDCGPNSAYVWD